MGAGCPAALADRPAGRLAAVRPGAFQARLGQFAHFRAMVGGQPIHLVHQQGRGPAPLPLLLTHGWPGSFCEYLDLMPLLTDPGAHGGDPGDAFTVVAPSLPGFGFSRLPPAEGLTADAVAGLWHRLMTEGLGYPRYSAHGSDLGAGITARLARAHPDAMAGIHLATPGLVAPPRPWSPAEEADFAQVDAWTGEEGGYAHLHSTKPATLGAALHDSPAGLAAWIGEKITAWSSTTADGQPAFPRDLLLGTLTLYWAPERSPPPCCLTGPTGTRPTPRYCLASQYRSPRPSQSSAGKRSPSQSRHASWPNATSPSPPGPSTTAAVISPPSPNRNCSPKHCATPSGRYGHKGRCIDSTIAPGRRHP